MKKNRWINLVIIISVLAAIITMFYFFPSIYVKAIYDYEKMVESLVNHEDMTEDEAREFIDYNATFYIEGGPIILYRLEE